jgi:hypothetical protein
LGLLLHAGDARAGTDTGTNTGVVFDAHMEGQDICRVEASTRYTQSESKTLNRQQHIYMHGKPIDR